MGATAFYGWPYPDPGSDVDVPRDIKALADKLELMKNGFTIPTGDLSVGLLTDVAGRYLRFRRNYQSAQNEFRAYCSGSAWSVVGMSNSVDAVTLSLFLTGVLQVTNGGVDRPLPFATYADIKNITLTSQANNAVTVTFPNGRFTATGTFPRPSVQVTAFGNVSYYGYSSGSGNASCSIGVCHRDGTAASATVETHMMAIQMNPTVTPGRAVVEPEPATRVATCHTEECENADIGIDVIDPDNEVHCGPCGVIVEDVVPVRKRK